MRLFFAAVLLGGLLQGPAFQVQHNTLKVPDGPTLLYGRAVPDGYTTGTPRPLVLALHPAAGNAPFHGEEFMRSIFLPGLRALDPIMVAPDCPTRSWTDPTADRAVMALMTRMLDEYSIDRRRILVVGFSLGGRGAWFMESHHPDLFTAAVVMAGPTDEPADQLARIPTYIIHSRADQVVPFGPAETRAKALEEMGRTVQFEPLDGLGHFEMGSYLPALMRAGRWVAARWNATDSR